MHPIDRRISFLAATIGLVVWPLATSPESVLHQPAKPLMEGATASPVNIGQFLFRDYVVPFEIVSLLLLVAMVGAIHMAKRPSREELSEAS